MGEDVTIGTADGLLRGRIENGVAAFKGVPYGDCGSSRRWQRARRVAPWQGVRDALDYGPRAIQPESRDMRVTSDQIEDLMSQGGPADGNWRTQSEDCLTLSVWTPAASGTRKLPVMFWCHGGKYFGETPPMWWFDGENLAAREEVVVVTVRHRVGVLGFLDLAGLSNGAADRATTANVGMLDLVDALEWVRDNIAAFGGDPDNVTIFGESGGGLKVSVLMAMPAAKGLFHKAIIQSGAQLEAQSREDATLNALALMTELGLEAHEVDGLFDIDPKRLVEAEARLAPSFASRPTGRRIEFEPVIDGDTLPEGCLDHAISQPGRDVPLLIGTCATETTFFMAALPNWQEVGEGQVRGMTGGMMGAEAGRILALYQHNRPEAKPIDLLVAMTGDFIFRRKAIRMAEERCRHADASTHMYVLAFETDVHGGIYRTPHILDLPLVFAHSDHPILGSDPARHDISRQMSGAWAAFARTGDPATALLPAWPAYDTDARATMFFEEHPQLVCDPRADERAIWTTPAERQPKDESLVDQL